MPESSGNIVLLLTATVNPLGTANTRLQDAEKRRLQYIEAINFYIDNTEHKLVVCENSGVDLSVSFRKEQLRDRVEFISFKGNDYNKKQGKSFGEILIMRYAFQKSEFLKDASFVAKITGRVKILNIPMILRQVEESRANSAFVEFWGKGFAQTVLFILPTKEFRELINGQLSHLDDNGYSLHHLLADFITSQKHLDLKAVYPQIDGISGKTGEPYINNTPVLREIDNYCGVANVYLERGQRLAYLASILRKYLFCVRMKLERN